MNTSMVRSGRGATVQILLNAGNSDTKDKGKAQEHWTALGSNAIYDESGNLASDVGQKMRAYGMENCNPIAGLNLLMHPNCHRIFVRWRHRRAARDPMRGLVAWYLREAF